MDETTYKQTDEHPDRIEGLALACIMGLGLYIGLQLQLAILWGPCALYFIYLLGCMVNGFITGVSSEIRKNSQP